MANTNKHAELESEFVRLFWAARGEHNRSPKAVSSNAHKAAIAFAKAQGWLWAEALLEASALERANGAAKALKILDKSSLDLPHQWRSLFYFVQGVAFNGQGEIDKAIAAYLKSLEDPKNNLPGKVWHNLGNAYYKKGQLDDASAAYQNALGDPTHDTPGDTWHNLGIVYGNKGDQDEAIKAYRRALQDPKNSEVGKSWHNLGIALLNKGEHDEAIKAYRKALEDPKHDTPGTVWHHLGMAFANKGEHEEAVKAYRKALEDPAFDTPGKCWNSLGFTLDDQGKYDEAIEAYRKALDDPKYDMPGNAWHNVGVAFSNKGEREKAIKAYLKAFEDQRYDTPGMTWNNLGHLYLEAGQRDHAKHAFQKALESSDPEGSEHARARLGLQLLKSNIESAALSPDDRAMTAKAVSGQNVDDLESGIIAAIQLAGNTQYDKYLERSDSGRDDTLSILRGWSSAVTLLEGSERRWRGGGYFLKWRGFGIVIDPGFDFLRNFHDAGYHGREINAVVVSHDHPDHNSDLKGINDLRYELYKRLAGTGKPGSQPYALFWDRDTYRSTHFGFEKPKHHQEPTPLSSGFPYPLDLRTHPINIPARVTPFEVQHGDEVPHAMGIVLELLDANGQSAVRIGYTGDTRYFEDLHKHLANCDILIAHISQPSIEELKDASKLKEVHLGYRGTARLLKECKPKLALIGEFWAGFTDLRISLTKGLRQRSGVEAVLPAGLAMHLRLPSLDIECTECKKPTAFSKVKVAPPTDNFGSLAYLCPHCMIG